MSRRDVALSLASKGLRIFPLRPGSKKPYAGEGVSVATIDTDRISRWFAERPDMNFGVSTDGLAVLDIDAKNGVNGFAQAKLLGLPPTMTVVSGNGGEHRYFVGAGWGQAPIAPGLDVRATGGYVVGPGCNVAGNLYVLVNDADPVPVPETLKAYLHPPGYQAERDKQVFRGELDTDIAVRRGVDYCREHAPAEQGSRNVSAYVVACTLKDFGLSEHTIAELMLEHWNNRNVPPLPDSDIEKLAGNAWVHGKRMPGCASTAADLPPIADSELPDTDPIFMEDVDFNIELEDTEPESWLVQDVLERGHLTGLVAEPGIGKSLFALGLAVGCARGDLTAFGFDFIGAPTSVAIVQLEDDTRTQRQRMLAICRHHGWDHRKLQGRVKWFSARDAGFKILGVNAQRRLQLTTQFEKFRQYVTAQNVGLVIFDPLVEMHDGDENSNGDMAKVMSAVRGLARGTDSAVLVVHHSRKPPIDGSGGGAGNMFTARGAGALVAGFRSSFTLTRPSADDCALYGISESLADWLIRFDRAKGNYSEPGRHTKFFKRVSVNAGNSRVRADGYVIPASRVPAFELWDAEGAMHATRDAYHRTLSTAALNAGDNGLSLADAVLALTLDPYFDAQGAPALKAQIETIFERPVTLDGVTLALETRKQRKVLVAYAPKHEVV
jgi:hypothetical protein